MTFIRATSADLLAYVILDWSESCVGHPLTDELAFFRPLSEKDRAGRLSLVGRLAESSSGCDPDRAKELLRPLMPLGAALTCAEFCAAIEPDERVYHTIDVLSALKGAAAIAAQSCKAGRTAMKSQ